MPRISRVVGVGVPHHVTQRGNYGGLVFESDFDKARYLALVSEYASQNALSILAYCLMPNHVHFVAVPGNEKALAITFKMAHARYAQYLNWKRNVKGHLWQGRFYSCILDGTHLLAAARYVERNPVRAYLAESADMWEWSSARTHLGRGGNEYGFDLEALWSFIPGLKKEWPQYLSQMDENETADRIRTSTCTGRPLCNDAFMRILENRLGRRLHAMPVGRPGADESARD